MSERANKTQISIIVLIAIIIVISTLAIVKFTAKSEGITAMEALEYSDVYAHEWNEDAKLISIGITDISFEGLNYTQDGVEGHYDEWFCTYAVLSTSTENASSISFKVCSNGSVIEQIRVDNSQIFDIGVEFISNWTIDSDEAYEIALNNTRVQDWLEQHPDSNLHFFYINHMDRAMWHLGWMDKSESNSSYLGVGITADTGEILVSGT